MVRRFRVFHTGLPQQVGAAVTLAADEAHHVTRVLRLPVAAAIDVFDGEGNEWRAQVASIERSRVTLRLERRLCDRVEAALGVVLFQGPCRPERMDWLVQKATELGVSRIGVVGTERVGPGRGGPRKLERWRRIAIEACKQCGRRRLPRVEGLDALPEPDPARALPLLLDPTATRPLGDLLEARPPAEVWIAVGPEGGFSPAELADHERAGWTRVALGPRILRSETAGLVAATLALHRWGDLGRCPAHVDSGSTGS